MQVPILQGVYARETPDLEASYPVNLMPFALDNGISRGYLRTAYGIETKAAITAADRGGVVYKGQHYRVVGSNLVRVSSSGSQTIIGAVGGSGPVRFAESFDYLAINAGTNEYLYNGTTLTQVTDPDLGEVLSIIWTDGYFMTTDGEFLVVSELNDPFAIDPLKYGSAEADPDPIVGLLEMRGEVFALNSNTIEVFGNSGSTGFPFVRRRGAQIPKGCVGRWAFAKFLETFAFCGSGKNEAPSIWLAGAGQAIRIAPRELEASIAGLTQAQLAAVEMEARTIDGSQELLVHLPTETWVYSWTASQKLDAPTWYKLAGGTFADQPYPGRNHTLVDNQWWVGSASALGVVSTDTGKQFAVKPGWSFNTVVLYNEGRGALIHDMELVTLTGRADLDVDPHVFLSLSDDGLTYGQERAKSLGQFGQRRKRVAWRRLGRFRGMKAVRFRGLVDAPVGFVRLEAQIEALA